MARKRTILSLALLSSLPAWSLDTKPWMGPAYGFEFDSAFSYSRFSKVEGASKQLSAPVNNRNILLDMSFVPTAAMDLQMETEFGKTDSVNWALRSAAVQGRMQLLDDICGDPVSLTLGINLRGAPHHFLRDVSTPYAAVFNMELSCSVGKEWSENGSWTMRTYGMATVGQANQGYPWTRELFVWQKNFHDVHRFTLFADLDVGFGNKQHVNVRHFDGWGKIQHQSLDLGAGYSYKMGVYGMLTALYAYRVFAHNYPERVNFVSLAYTIPFSLF